MVFNLVRAVAEAADRVLDAVVSPPLEMLLEQSKELAMSDAEYARLMAERKEEGRIEWSNYKSARAIRDTFASHPWWEDAARTVHRNPATKLVNQTEWAWQRLTRGWDDTALWSLDSYWARTMSAQLLAMAEVTHGWPQGEEFPEYEDWVTALRENAELLAAYGTMFDLASIDEEAAAVEGGQKAMRWIAEHFPSLWD